MPYFPLHGPNHLKLRFYTIMQDFKRVLEFNCKKKEDITIKNFRLDFNVENLVLSNGSELVQNVIQWD